MMHPRMREAMSQGNSGRLPPAQPLKTQMSMSSDGTTARLPVQAARATGPSSVGTLGIIMPIYSIVIVLFFIYTMFKLITRDNEEEEQESTVQEKKETRLPCPPSFAQRFPFLVPKNPAPKSRRRYDHQPSPIYVAASSAFKEFQLIKKIYGLDNHMRKRQKPFLRDPRAPSCGSSLCRFRQSCSKSHLLSSHSVSCSELPSTLFSSDNVPSSSSHHRSRDKNVDKRKSSSRREFLEETNLRRRAFSI